MLKIRKRLSDIRWATFVAKSYIGTPYIWGGDDPIAGVDCSGLVINILQSVGRLPYRGDWTAEQLSKMFVEASTPNHGVLAFFGSIAKITHVGFCLDKYKMIEAGGGGRDNISKEAAIAKNAYVRVRPIDARTDLVKLSDPFDKNGYR